MGCRRIGLGAIAAVLMLNAVPPLVLVATPAPVSLQSADQLMQQGLQHYQAGRLTEAIAIWQQAEAQYRQTQNSVGQANALFHLGTALVTVERYREAIAALEAFLPLARSTNDPASEARALSNLGIAYKELGRYSQAITSHRAAGKLMRTLGDRQSLGQVLTNLGNAFEAVGDYSNALIAYEQGLKIARQLGDRVGESVALGNLGAIYANQGKDREAIATFEQSLTLAKAIPYEPGQSSVLLNLGAAYHGLRQPDRAISYYEESLALARKLGDRRQEANVLGSLGLVLEDRKDYANAVQHHKKSLEIARSLNDLESQAMALNNLGHTLLKAGQLAPAEATLREAIQRLDALRPELNDRYKVSIFDTQLHTYNLLQQVLIAANKHEAALEAAEWGRARAFAERLAKRVREADSGKATGTAAIAPIRIQEIKQIAQEQKATLVEYSIVPDDDFKFRGKQRGRESDLLIWVVQPSGKVHFRRVNLKPLWQQDLNLAKLVMASRNCLYPGADCTVKADPAPTQASSRSGQPSQRPQRRINPALHRLHQLLIQPIADLLPKNSRDRVILLPLESLFLVPFPALQNAEGQYLIEQHTLLTAPAIQVLALTQQIQQQRQPANRKSRDRFLPALIVGNPTMPMIGSEELSALPASEEEAKQIADLLKVKALLGQDATQSTVVQQMPQASLIHLATHGLLEYGQALGETDVPGAIALAPDPASTHKTTPNGILTANEIVDFRLQADLVVLSACDTGRGRITGDGVIGLSRAFISAGVPSIVVSLWAVSDVSTAHLMGQFYQNLLTQPDKAKALRFAMLETMKQYPRPLDWAAFTLVGEAD